MSVTLASIPELSFSRNPIVAQLVSDDVVDVQGVATVWVLEFTGAITDGLEIPIIWTNRSLKMKAKNSPDESGFQFPTGDGSTGYVATILSWFQANYYLDRDFLITLHPTDAKIIFTGRAESASLNVTPQSAGSFNISITTAGVTEQNKPNFKHLVEVWLSGKKIKSLSLSLDPDGRTTNKDLSDVIHASLYAAGSDKPDMNATTWQACPNTLQTYFLKYAQFYGDNPEVKRLHTSPLRYVNRGGLDLQAALGQTLAAYLRPGGAGNDPQAKCLRQGSKKKLIQADQPEFLYWINLTGSTKQVRLYVEVFYTVGLPSNYFTPVFAADANKKYYVPVDVNSIGLIPYLQTGKIATGYSVRLYDDVAQAYLSVSYTYTFDQFRRWPRYFIYLNALGGYQTLYTYGKAEPMTSISKQDVNREVTPEQAVTGGRSVETNIRLQDGEKVNTGYKTAREIRLLKDFLSSEEKYKVDGKKLIPIGTRTDKLPLPVDGDNLNAAEFEWYPKYDERVYTDDASQADGTLTDGGGSGLQKGFNVVVDNGTNPKYYVNL